jgi:hypothetical protein
LVSEVVVMGNQFASPRPTGASTGVLMKATNRNPSAPGFHTVGYQVDYGETCSSSRTNTH